MDLRRDDAVEWDVRILLRVVAGLDPIDPHLDPGSFSENTKFVPAKGVHALQKGHLVHWGGIDESAAVLVIDLAEPTLPAIDLVTGDRTVRQAGTADLNSAVDLSRVQIAGTFDLQGQLKIRVTLLRADELILGNVLVIGSRSDGSAIHTPEPFGADPAMKCFSIEQGNGVAIRLSNGER